MREPRPVASRRWQFGRQRPWVFRGSTAVPRLPVSSSLKQKGALLVRLRPISDGRKVVRPDAWALTAGLGPRMPRPGRDCAQHGQPLPFPANLGWRHTARFEGISAGKKGAGIATAADRLFRYPFSSFMGSPHAIVLAAWSAL